ncbi:MAG: cystathionine gamma-synthase [Acidobacteria bacterium]|nr:cystathionine gamma-synthase [Acidobacteriota bacterium]MBV9069562.1 cystathionine gamma-synthase [Acidobacteriota bacterium]MBV9186018.1 cystathionine gamma-synthase [Acidobacteriota bacterium]
MGFSTDCIHAGQEPEPVTGAVTYPIFQTSTYVQPELGKHKGFEYARTKNPTRSVLEANLAALERGKHAHCFASGMSATDTVFRMLKSGDHVVAGENMYGGSFRLFNKVCEKFGLQFTYVDTACVEKVRAALRPNTKIVFLETPTNPMMTVTDIAACAEVAHKNDSLVVVDNTFCSPWLQQPLELGADIVVHSTTKFLNGHSDSVGGVVITNDDAIAEQIGFLQNAVGAILSPMDSWLILRGVKTLAVRMKQHEENGRAMADYLSRQPKALKVYYPGLPDHPQHELAKRQMRGFGAMISFELGSLANAKKFLDRVRLCSLGESLGGVETLISHPETMTHASVPLDTRTRLGITPGLVRISVGIEDVEDLIADVEQAFAAV